MPGKIKQQKEKMTRKMYDRTQSTLQGHKSHKFNLVIFEKKTYSKKQKSNNSEGNNRAYFFASSQGSITIETAISMTVFLWILFVWMNFFQIIAQANKIYAVYDEVIEDTVRNQYAILRGKQMIRKDEKEETSKMKEMVENRITGVALQLQLEKKLGSDFMNQPEIKNGSGAIKVIVNKEEENQIETTLSYKVVLRGTKAYKQMIPITRKSAVGLWKGKSLKENRDSEKVYMTENGTVFHVSLKCNSLNLKIKSIDKSAISFQRNQNGEKYYPCRFCLKGNGSQYYITEDGNRYHDVLSCSRLKRTIRILQRSQVKGIPECKKCGSNE